MQFGDVTLITEDVMRLRAFYEALFGRAAEGDEAHSVIAIDGLAIVFDSVKLLAGISAFHYVTGQSSDNTILSFNVADVDAEYERIKALGARMLNAPTTHPWGARSFQCKDPDGNVLNFRMVWSTD